MKRDYYRRQARHATEDALKVVSGVEENHGCELPDGLLTSLTMGLYHHRVQDDRGTVARVANQPNEPDYEIDRR